MTNAYAGMVGDSSMVKQIDSFISEESSAEMAFGIMVGQGTADNGCLLLATVNDNLIGVTVHSHRYAKDQELGDTGLLPEATVQVMSQGRIWVQVEEAVTPASGVHVRAVATGNEVAGAFRDTQDGTDTIDISGFAKYLTSAGANGFALLEFDMRNRSA